MEETFNVQVFDGLRGNDWMTGICTTNPAISTVTYSGYTFGGPVFDVVHEQESTTVCIDIPGAVKDSIGIVYDNEAKALTYSGIFLKKADTRTAAAKAPSYGNRPAGKFTYSVLVGKSVDITKCTATYELGVLIVKLPLAQDKHGSIAVK